MSRKYIRRFIRYHPGLFQDKKLICLMATDKYNIDLSQLSRTIIRYRKAESSDYLILRLRRVANSLHVDFHEILALNRTNEFIDC